MSLAALAAVALCQAASAATVEQLRARCHAGQVFLTWAEPSGDHGGSFSVYIHDLPISEGNLGRARLLARNELQQALSDLKFLLNLPEADSLSLTDDLAYLPLAGELGRLKEYASENHPAVRSAEYSLAGETSRRKLALLQFLPDPSYRDFPGELRRSPGGVEMGVADRFQSAVTSLAQAVGGELTAIFLTALQLPVLYELFAGRKKRMEAE